MMDASHKLIRIPLREDGILSLHPTMFVVTTTLGSSKGGIDFLPVRGNGPRFAQELPVGLRPKVEAAAIAVCDFGFTGLEETLNVCLLPILATTRPLNGVVAPRFVNGVR